MIIYYSHEEGSDEMQCVERYNKYKDESLDTIILKIRNGTIKCGRYAHLVKIDSKKILKGKEFFHGQPKDDTGESGQ